MNKTVSIFAIFSLFFLSFTACSDDDHPEHIHDHEDIHGIELSVMQEDGSNLQTYSFHHGENVIDMILLQPNQSYIFEITALLVQHGTEMENHLHEIIEHKNEHIFLYQTTASLSLERIDDSSAIRSDGNPLGIKTRITTGSTSSGILQIELKHNSSNVSASANNNMGSAVGGATDLLATFGVSF